MAFVKVVLDSENVDFDGDPPGSVSDLWNLIENFLGQSNRVIDAFIIDGEAWSPEMGEPPESCQEIQIVSVSETEKAFQLVNQLLAEKDKLIELWMTGASESLSQPWMEFQSQALEILNETQPAVQSIQVLSAFGRQKHAEWGSRLSQTESDLSERLNSVIDHFENGDYVSYSDASAELASTGLNRVFETLLRDAKPALRGAV